MPACLACRTHTYNVVLVQGQQRHLYPRHRGKVPPQRSAATRVRLQATGRVRLLLRDDGGMRARVWERHLEPWGAASRHGRARRVVCVTLL
jgi:hypothetical protein